MAAVAAVVAIIDNSNWIKSNSLLVFISTSGCELARIFIPSEWNASMSILSAQVCLSWCSLVYSPIVVYPLIKLDLM